MMPTSKPPPSASPSRAATTRRRILDAAERLLRVGSADFSMRDLAAEAGVSFATPFNQFGSKIVIMQAISAERIALMAERFAQASGKGDAVDRVLAAVDIASDVMLADPQVNRAVIGSLGAPSEDPGRVRAQSRALWQAAIREGDGLPAETADVGRTVLPDHLAVAFRGVLSFWTAGEIPDAELKVRARAVAAALLLGFVEPGRRGTMMRGFGAASLPVPPT